MNALHPNTRYYTPWGWEQIIEHTKKYVVKHIHVRKGNRLSKQYHEKKLETWFFIKEGKLIKLKTIKPKEVHRLEAKDYDVDIIEVSTPELTDVVRVEDDYGRAEIDTNISSNGVE